MSIRYDMLKLSAGNNSSLCRLARKLVVELPDTHTIIINRKPGIMRPKELCDFEMAVFINSESEAETDRKIAELKYGKGAGSPSDSTAVYHPGMAFEKREPSPSLRDTRALYYDFPTVSKELRDNYLEFLRIHEKFFTKHNFLNITTVNSSEMRRCNPAFYGVYITNLYEKGYLIFNGALKPQISLPGGVKNQALLP